jgi:hypothetical protein
MIISIILACISGADPGFANGGGADYGERAEREPRTGVWGQSPWWESGGKSPQKLTIFGVFHIQTSG